MNEYHPVPVSDAPELLTVIEAAAILRIGRTTAYGLAREFVRTAGESGLPVVRVGRQLRVPRDCVAALVAGEPKGLRPVDDGVTTVTRAADLGAPARLFEV